MYVYSPMRSFFVVSAFCFFVGIFGSSGRCDETKEQAPRSTEIATVAAARASNRSRESRL